MEIFRNFKSLFLLLLKFSVFSAYLFNHKHECMHIISFSIIHILSVREKKIGEHIHNKIQAYIYTACD